MKKTIYKSLIRDLRKSSGYHSCCSEVEKLVTMLDCILKSQSMKSYRKTLKLISAVQRKIDDNPLKCRLEDVRRQLQSQKDKFRNENCEDYSYSATIGTLDFCSEYDC